MAMIVIEADGTEAASHMAASAKEPERPYCDGLDLQLQLVAVASPREGISISTDLDQ